MDKIKTKSLPFSHWLGQQKILVLATLSLLAAVGISVRAVSTKQQQLAQASQEFDASEQIFEDKLQGLELDLQEKQALLASASAQLSELQNRDEYTINLALEEEIENINQTYQLAVGTYETLLKAEDADLETEELEVDFTEALLLLSERNYASASSMLATIEQVASAELSKLAAKNAVPKAPVNNTPPGSGYSRQTVQTDVGSFVVDLVAGDLSSTRVIVDTASDGDCGNDCPVLSLGDYVSRSGAYAGVNGSYFCPASYPSCAGKTNSFDTLAMNKNKVYFNSDNNVYSTVPAVIFGNGWVRFVGRSLEWGRDTGVDGVLANQPLLVSGGNVVFGGDSDPKKGSKSNRSFVANKGNIVYIGVVRNVTTAESARVLATLGMENALNLDSGGSTALWSGGYKAGPGRNIPNAILFVRK